MRDNRPQHAPLDALALVTLRSRLRLPPWGMRFEGEPSGRGRIPGADAVRRPLPLHYVLLTPAGRAVYNASN